MSKTILFVVIGLFCLFTCCDKRFIGSRKICDKNNVYLLIYRVFPVDLNEAYLTDSTNFRVLIGRYDQQIEFYTYRCHGDAVFVEKYNRNSASISDTILSLVEKRVFSLDILRKERKFE
jgi:hypothetical protein